MPYAENRVRPTDGEPDALKGASPVRRGESENGPFGYRVRLLPYSEWGNALDTPIVMPKKESTRPALIRSQGE
jgi:hypothetical protein